MQVTQTQTDRLEESTEGQVKKTSVEGRAKKTPEKVKRRLQ